MPRATSDLHAPAGAASHCGEGKPTLHWSHAEVHPPITDMVVEAAATHPVTFDRYPCRCAALTRTWALRNLPVHAVLSLLGAPRSRGSGVSRAAWGFRPPDRVRRREGGGMAGTSYRVITTGRLQPGIEPAAVLGRHEKAFPRVDPDLLRQMVAGRSVIQKRGMDLSKASTYAHVLEQAGLECRWSRKTPHPHTCARGPGP